MNDRTLSLIRFDRFTLDLMRGCLLHGAEEIQVRPKAYDVLRYLTQHPDRLVSKDEILAAVWPKVTVTDDSLVHCVTELRQALGDREQRLIKTIPRRGYRFVAPISWVTDETPDGDPVEAVENAGKAQVKRTVAGIIRLRSVRAAATTLTLLFLLVFGAAGWWWHTTRGVTEGHGPALPDRPSIAVLPFDNLAGDDRQKRLAAAFAEDLIGELARFRDVLVIARNSSFAYQGEPMDVRKIGLELGVRYVLGGSLQSNPGRVRVTTQLIDASDGMHLWSERYDRPAAEFFGVRDEVVGRIVGTLMGYSGPLATAGMGAAHRKRPESLQAYDYYLLAKEPYIRHDAAGMSEARGLLAKALELDPGFVRAWELLAWTHFRDAFNGWGNDPQSSWDAFHRAARKAAALDPLDGGAHVVLGMSHFMRDEVEQGAAAWDRALALSPNDANVLRPIGAQLALALGLDRAQQGLELAERAMRLDPLHPAIVASAVGFAAYFAERYDTAIEAFRKKPSLLFDHRAFLAMSYAQLGQLEEAQVEVAEVLRQKPDFSVESFVDHDFFQPGGTSARLVFEGARKAGLPLCAPAMEAARLEPRNRLSECETDRAKGVTLGRNPI